MDDITTPEQLAKVLSIVTGGEFTPDELLSNAHALLVACRSEFVSIPAPGGAHRNTSI
jgi:hypothetical protein